MKRLFAFTSGYFHLCSFLFILSISVFSYESLFARLVYPDFTLSMMRDGNSLYKYEDVFIKKQKKGDFSNTKYLEIFRNIYARNIIKARMLESDSLRIPLIVHQIWLGGQVPKKYCEWMKSWANLIGWEYKLWTDDDVKEMILYNQELYDHSSNYGEKSDILRLEILWEYGGLYVDVDYECMKPEIFYGLHKSFDFYIGFEPIEHGLVYDMYKTCNALVGAAPGHPLILDFMEHMNENAMEYQYKTAVEKTGPDYLSRIIFAYEQNNINHQYRNMYLPCTFFYPFSAPEIRTLSQQELLLQLPLETAAIHYWTGSWMDAQEPLPYYLSEENL
ncbi:MAG: TcdA/TcdB catalytic glycosyltransferase domain-containing protein [Candidatus Rhabdochlamydia sp.]